MNSARYPSCACMICVSTSLASSASERLRWRMNIGPATGQRADDHHHDHQLDQREPRHRGAFQGVTAHGIRFLRGRRRGYTHDGKRGTPSNATRALGVSSPRGAAGKARRRAAPCYDHGRPRPRFPTWRSIAAMRTAIPSRLASLLPTLAALALGCDAGPAIRDCPPGSACVPDATVRVRTSPSST